MSYYKELGIKAVWHPIHDFDAGNLSKEILPGARKLVEMLDDEDRNVYVHCTAGMGRAPAVVLTYLSCFKGLEPSLADLYVKSYRSVSAPNMGVV